MNLQDSQLLTRDETDLVGGPFAVVESDPGVFTSLIRKLGVRGIEVKEVYDIQPWGLDSLKSKGLILCFTWKDEKNHTHNFLDNEARDKIWFANQLIDDACASLAILNVLLNVPSIDLGPDIEHFKTETVDMSPKMKGLAISNSRLIRETQNSLARPADLWGSISSIAETTHEVSMSAKKPTKRRRTVLNDSSRRKQTSRRKKAIEAGQGVESFHFIGYVPAHGKVWELDGMNSGPLEVGELSSSDPDSIEGWEDIVRPALRLKMEKYGGVAGIDVQELEDYGNIQFNLLALVPDQYEERSDELELLKREKTALELRLGEIYGTTWTEKVNQEQLARVRDIFPTPDLLVHGESFAKDFGLQAMNIKMSIMSMKDDQISELWSDCINRLSRAKVAMNEETQKEAQVQAENLKRTHNYDPFIRAFMTALDEEGLLSACIHDAQNH